MESDSLDEASLDSSTKENIIFLNYFGTHTLQFYKFIEGTLYQKYEEIQKRDDPEDTKRISMAEIEWEILCKNMELIEFLASICYSLDDYDKNILDNIIDFGDPLAHITKISKQNEFEKLLTYPNINELSINEDEKEILNQIYKDNYKGINAVFSNIKKFYEKNKIAYNKHKHSRPIIVIPIDYDKISNIYAVSKIYFRKKEEVERKLIQIIHGKTVIKEYLSVSKMIIKLAEDILENRIFYLGTKTKRIPQISYFEVSEDVDKFMSTLNKKVHNNQTKLKLTCKSKVEIEIESIENDLHFYTKELYSSKLGKDEYLEELINRFYSIRKNHDNI